MNTLVFVVVCILGFLGVCGFLGALVVAVALRDGWPECNRDEHEAASTLYPPFGRDVCGTTVSCPRAVSPAAGMTKIRREGQRGHS